MMPRAFFSNVKAFLCPKKGEIQLTVTISGALGMAVVSLAIATNSPTSYAKVKGNTITLGAVLSSSGRFNVNGGNTYNGYELAIQRINEAGGVSVQGKKFVLTIETYDDKSDPARANRLTERLIKEDQITFMLGPYSSELTKAVANVTEDYKIPLVEAEGASRDLFNRGNRYIFGLLSTCEHYLANVVDLAVAKARQTSNDPKDLKLAIAVQNERFSLCLRTAVLERAKNFGVKIVVDVKLPSEITDMSWMLKKVGEETPDVLVISGHSMGAEVAVRQMEEMQIRVPITAITHCEAAKIVEKFGSATEGIYCPAQWAPSLPYEDGLFGTAKDFSDAMKSAYPDEKYVEVPYQAASAAAAVIVWKDAFERANSFDTEKLREALSETDLMTFYGRIRFAPTGQIISKPMILRQIRNGQFVVVEPEVAYSSQ
jgi:branched-chain amino acid transport system substrate-binding protein